VAVGSLWILGTSSSGGQQDYSISPLERPSYESALQIYGEQEVKAMFNLYLSVPKGFRLTVKRLSDGTTVMTLEPI